jgi:hypothetical protein
MPALSLTPLARQTRLPFASRSTALICLLVVVAVDQRDGHGADAKVHVTRL